MLSTVAALPLLLAATLDVPSAAPARPATDTHAAEPMRGAEPPPAPSIEGAQRPPEPALRRCWCAEGGDVARAGGPAATGSSQASPVARVHEEGRVQRLRTRGPPPRAS